MNKKELQIDYVNRYQREPLILQANIDVELERIDQTRSLADDARFDNLGFTPKHEILDAAQNVVKTASALYAIRALG